MKAIKETGGGKIGMAQATWPFVKLTVNNELLELNASIIGKYVFRPIDVESIEIYSLAFKTGIKINHRVSNYNDKVIFWPAEDAKLLIKKIEQTGFVNNNTFLPYELESQISKIQMQGAFPLQRTPTIVIAAVWLISIIVNFSMISKSLKPTISFGPAIQLGLSFLLLISILVQFSRPVRSILLKEGRTVADIQFFLYFFQFICGLFLLISLFVK